MSAREHLLDLAAALQRREISLDRFLEQAQAASVAELAEARVDLDRQRRCGFPEVVYAPGKSPQALESVIAVLLEQAGNVLATRVEAGQAEALSKKFPAGRYNALARTFRIGAPQSQQPIGKIAIVSAGTSDLPVVEEARETAEWMKLDVVMLGDVGVAGPQRFLQKLDMLSDVDAVVVVAGMEGALPSMVGGFVACPVIAVPTSVGYGANLGGITPLLAMLSSCASNVAVVNIDAGFKGAYVAGLIARRAALARSQARS